MSTFPIDRTHPPSRIVYRHATRYLELRPWAFGDVDAILDAVTKSLPELKAFMPWAHSPLTRESQYAFVAKAQADYHAGREYTLGMFSESAEVLGCVGVHPRVALNPRALEVGYWCHTAHAGKGWTTLAVRVLAVVAFDLFGADRLQVTYDEENVASRRVVEKCGFPLEGVVRNVVASVADELPAGGYRGSCRHRLHALVPEDLPQLEWVPEVRAGLTVFDAFGRR